LQNFVPSEVADPYRWLAIRQPNAWFPPTDVFEQDECMVVLVEIAGMRDTDFAIRLRDRVLTVSGVRTPESRNLLAAQQTEIHYGDFRVEVLLPVPVERAQVSASYRDGFLRVTLPRAANQQIHIVDVEQEAESS